MTQKIYLQDILPLDKLRLEGNVLLVRHYHKDINKMIQQNLIDSYQSYQDKPAFRNSDYLVSFLGSERNTGIFYGLFKIEGIIENENIPPYPKEIKPYCRPISESDFYLKLTRLNEYDKFKNRLIIDWVVPRGWFNTYGKVKNKEVVKILPYNYVKDFPGLMNIKLGYNELKKIIQNPDSHIDWLESLSRLQAVYLILDKRTGFQYIGTTYGKEGLWQRWSTYAKGDGTGGNRQLKELKDRNPNFSDHLQFTILEVLSKTASPKECMAIESKWKGKLGSRAFGLNNN